MSASWVDSANLALLVDLYELTMLQAYLDEGLDGSATFSLLVRRLPPGRSFLLACGLEELLDQIAALTFTEASLAYLESLSLFSRSLLDYLRGLRWDVAIDAMPEGTPLFAAEPLLEITGPLPQVQLLETLVMNQVHLATMAASKAARMVEAARGRTVIDFGLRRMHGADAGVKVARAAYLAGIDGTSNVLAGRLYGIPVAGTMAHSYIQAHDRQLDAFRAFSRTYPDTVLLVDTYDTLAGVRDVVRLARELGPAFRVSGIRLDSGDLGDLARRSRALLDRAGLGRVRIFASGGLDERAIARLLDDGAPIDAFGVGTALGVSQDAPALDMAYKLVAYAGRSRLKLSPGKALWPGPKQVFRTEENGVAAADVLSRRDEHHQGRPLLQPVMRHGQRLHPPASLEVLRQRTRAEIERLPARLRALDPADPPYRVEVSPRLRAEAEALRRELSPEPEPEPAEGPPAGT